MALVNDGWEKGCQMTAPGIGNGGRWQAIGDDLEQQRTMAAAARGRDSIRWRHGDRLTANDDTVIASGGQRSQWWGPVKPHGAK